jgi:hypothetical protein
MRPGYMCERNIFCRKLFLPFDVVPYNRRESIMSSGATAAKQPEIQDQVEKAEKKENSRPSGAVQAGARRCPLFPKVHGDKPGSEADLKTEDDAEGQFAPSQADRKATGVQAPRRL